MSNQVTWFTADPHFCHEKAVEFRSDMGWNDYEEMNEEIIYRWNQSVRPSDIVYVLGDFALCGGVDERKEALEGVIQRLNGYIHLVMGNHDNMWSDPLVADAVFDRIHGVKEYKGCILTHVPVAKTGTDRYRANIHGHLHHMQVMQPPELVFEKDPVNEEITDIQVIERIDPWYFCVSMDQHDYAPLAWAEINDELKRRRDGSS